jgi:XRE family transcriptional regulator, regulator of sulfur utilization
VFGRNVKRLRLAHGWMQSDLAAYTGLERAYLSRLEGGKVEPCLRSIQTIAKALGATIGQLVGEA